MDSLPTDGIGGFLPLEGVIGHAPEWLGSASEFRSARDAMHAWFVAMAPEKIWLPHHICDDVIPAAASVAPIRRFALADDLGPREAIGLGPRDAVVVVDYLGGATDRVLAALDRIGASRTLVDASQSFGFPHQSAPHIVYSPRKFAGLPDGGLLITSLAIPKPAPDSDDASLARCGHLLLRAAGLRDSAYAAFREAEEGLRERAPFGMSQLTRGLLARVDFAAIAATRRNNAARLSERLGAPASPFAAAMPMPLSFPLGCTQAAAARAKLREHSVFVPHFWPGDAPPATDRLGRHLRDNILCLPCDQRYDARQMDALADAVGAVLINL